MDGRTGRDRVETTETGWWPGGDHSVDRARRSSQELVEPGGDHRRGTTRKWIARAQDWWRVLWLQSEVETLMESVHEIPRKWDDKKVEFRRRLRQISDKLRIAWRENQVQESIVPAKGGDHPEMAKSHK